MADTSYTTDATSTAPLELFLCTLQPAWTHTRRQQQQQQQQQHSASIQEVMQGLGAKGHM
jgi:hypothetical protein